MTDEQLKLMATIVLSLCSAIDIIKPYYSYGNINVGQCGLCGVVGDLHYPDIFYDHKPGCLMTLAGQLQKSLQEKEQKSE